MIGHGLNNNNIYDLSVYDKNKVLFTTLTTLKMMVINIHY